MAIPVISLLFHYRRFNTDNGIRKFMSNIFAELMLNVFERDMKILNGKAKN